MQLIEGNYTKYYLLKSFIYSYLNEHIHQNQMENLSTLPQEL